jgi:hypothetical protein
MFAVILSLVKINYLSRSMILKINKMLTKFWCSLIELYQCMGLFHGNLVPEFFDTSQIFRASPFILTLPINRDKGSNKNSKVTRLLKYQNMSLDNSVYFRSKSSQMPHSLHYKYVN